MAFPLLSLLTPLLGPVTDVVKTVLNRILPPEKMSEAQRAEFDAAVKGIEAQLTTQLLNMDTTMLDKQMQIIISETQGQSWLQRNWRPILMLCIVAIVANNYILFPYINLFFPGKSVILELPAHLWSLMEIGVGGYIVGRSAEKVVTAWKKGQGNGSEE